VTSTGVETSGARRLSLAVIFGLTGLVALAFLAFAASSAKACGQSGDAGPPIPPTVVDNGDGSETHTYYCGPITVTGGQNRILFPQMKSHEKPDRNGWITSLEPDLVAVDDKSGELYVPTSDKVMFHHGVWINNGKRDATSGGGERFYATGEEKTQLRLPEGYGYFYRWNESWVLNHMIHNLVPTEFTMYIVWKVNFVPDTAPQAGPEDSDLARSMKPVRPIWMDIDNGSHYPIFDTWRGDGGKDGKFTFPDDTYGKQGCPARRRYISTYTSRCYPYEEERVRNRWTVDRDGYIVFSVGHVHSGGLWTDLNLIREGVPDTGPVCTSERAALNQVNGRLGAANRKIKRLRKKAARIPASRKARKAAARRAVTRQQNMKRKLFALKSGAEVSFQTCWAPQPRIDDDYLTDNKRVRVFRSGAEYFDPERRQGRKGRPVSWDMGMYNTAPEFGAQLEAGDVLETSTTYETKIGSWFESMGIHISYMADGQGEDAEDPFETRLDNVSELNHGPLPENVIHGGKPVRGAVDPARLPNGPSPSRELLIQGYTFGGGDFFQLPREVRGRPLVVERGKSLRFRLPKDGADWNKELWHSLTACKAPCNRSTGIAYPLPDGEPMFDSGQLGEASIRTGANGEEVWETPKNLPVGTHTFYCRIHPLMRGAVRVVKKK